MDLLIVHVLHMHPIIHLKLNVFKISFIEDHLDTYHGTSMLTLKMVDTHIIVKYRN